MSSHTPEFPRPPNGTGAIAAPTAVPFTQRPTVRPTPMRLLCLGLCRTGTSSLQAALQSLGLPEVYHMASLESAGPGEAEAWLEILEAKRAARTGRPPLSSPTHGEIFTPHSSDETKFWTRLLGRAEAVTDVPCALFAPELLRVFPDAPVLLTVRPGSTADANAPAHHRGAASWARSMQDTILPMIARVWFMTPTRLSDAFVAVAPLPRQILARRATLDLICGGGPGGETEAEKGRRLEGVYVRHNEGVVRACEEVGRRCVVWDASEGWEPLVALLNEGGGGDGGGGRGFEVPRGVDGQVLPFPRLNDTVTFRAVVGEKTRVLREKVRWAVGVFGWGVVGIAAVVVGVRGWRGGVGGLGLARGWIGRRG